MNEQSKVHLLDIGSDEIDGAGKTFLDNAAIDHLADALLELTAALWVTQDRQIVLEQILQQLLGKDLSSAIERYEPSDEVQALRSERRAALVSDVFRAMQRAGSEEPGNSQG